MSLFPLPQKKGGMGQHSQTISAPRNEKKGENTYKNGTKKGDEKGKK